MILYPPAKINLGLKVLFKREDGFHELETIMVPIPFYDVLEMLPFEKDEFIQTGIHTGSLTDNLCVKALNLLRESYSIPPVYMHLHKQIPIGAGLGGGSADCAYVINGLNELFNLNISIQKRESLAAKLGSDCPFFIKNTAQLAKGRGEILSEIALDLNGYYLKIVNPNILISTKEAYAGVVVGGDNQQNLASLILDIASWRNELKNDFEISIFKKHKLLKEIKDQMYNEGAIYASMSGSGSTMFGIYQSEPKKSYTNTDFLEVVLHW